MGPNQQARFLNNLSSNATAPGMDGGDHKWFLNYLQGQNGGGATGGTT
jgi:hypothetical protein